MGFLGIGKVIDVTAINRSCILTRCYPARKISLSASYPETGAEITSGLDGSRGLP